jgi:PIN domain nuclease of toxin-antitoxin system
VKDGDLLLDTNATLWAFNEGSLSAPARDAIDQAWVAGRPILVSKITAWEIGMLVSKRRITLPSAPIRWFSGVLETPGMALADLTPELLIEASNLPDSTLRDPADQMIVATARAHGLRLLTRDRQILDYAEAGHLLALAC